MCISLIRPFSPRRRGLRRCIQKQFRSELDNLDIAWHVLTTSMRRFHSSFRIFSIYPAVPGPPYRSRASLVAALTHHPLYIAPVETPDIIFDFLFRCHRSLNREAVSERGKKNGYVRNDLKIGDQVSRESTECYYRRDRWIYKQPPVIPELTTRVRDDINVVARVREPLPIFRPTDRQAIRVIVKAAHCEMIIDASVC